MSDPQATGAFDAEGRPTSPLPLGHLLRISLYWHGPAAVLSGLLHIVNGRLQFTGLVPRGREGVGALEISVVGTVIAIIVQPTIGSISD